MDEQIILEEELIAEERAIEAARLGSRHIHPARLRLRRELVVAGTEAQDPPPRQGDSEEANL